MRLKFTKQFKMLIVFLVILISAYLARYGTLFSKKTVVNEDNRRVQREFKFSKNLNKHEMQFSVNNMQEFLSHINNIESEFAESMNILRKQSASNSFIFMAEFRHSDFNNVISKIRAYETVSAKKEESLRGSVSQLDLAERLDINEALKKRYMHELQNPRHSAISANTEARLNSVQATIDSLKNAIKEQDYFSNNSLLLVMVNQVASESANVYKSGFLLARNFAMWFFGLTLAMLIVLFLFDKVLTFMSYIGIHTASGGKGGKSGYKYGSSYKYGGGYSYGSSKRKVKRIYKDKDEKSDEGKKE